MRIERTKNAVLTLLILSSLWMTGQIWFNEKLWPNGYDFFVVLQNSSIGRMMAPYFVREAPESEASRTSIAVPHTFVVSMVRDFNHINLQLTQKEAAFGAVSDYTAGIMKQVFGKEVKNAVLITEEEWQNRIHASSIYVDYGVAYHTKTFGSFLEVHDTQLASVVAEVREFVMAPGDSVTNDVMVLIRDDKTGQIYKLYSGTSKSDLLELFTKLSLDATSSSNFSFSLGADISSGRAGEVLFDPYMMLNQLPQQNGVILSKNVLLRGNGEERKIHPAVTDRILRVFQINPNTVKKYIDASSTQVFIENQATLKISPSGMIDYTAIAGAKGLKLSTPSQTTSVSAYRNAYYGADFMDRIITAADMQVSGVRVAQFAETNAGIRLGFDYLCKGIPIVLKDDGLCVEMEIEGGYLKRYRQFLRSYELTEAVVDNLSTYKAADALYSTLPKSEDSVFIRGMFIGYADDMAEGEKIPGWVARVDGVEGWVSGFDIKE